MLNKELQCSLGNPVASLQVVFRFLGSGRVPRPPPPYDTNDVLQNSPDPRTVPNALKPQGKVHIERPHVVFVIF